MTVDGPANGGEAPAGSRYEMKYLARPWHYDQLIAWLRLRPEGFRPTYPARRVNNAYLDRGDADLYRDSVEGCSSRAKVRYRWYGDSALPDAGRLEIKLRRNQLGWKKVFDVHELDGTLDRWPDVRARIRDEVPPEGRIWLAECHRVLIVNRYRREYWESADGRLRVTFDHDPSVFDQRFGSCVNRTRAALIEPGVVFEVKCGTEQVEAASRLVSSMPLTLRRNSKYCNAIEAVIQN